MGSVPKITPVPPRLVTFGERAEEVVKCYSPKDAWSTLSELLGWLNSRRLREKFTSDSNALFMLGELSKEARRSEDMPSAEVTVEVAERLLRDKASRTTVWRA